MQHSTMRGLALALALVSAPSFARAACTEVTAPATISAPGTYCLANDYTTSASTGPSLTIASNDVTLDCQQHTLKNTSTFNNGSASGIYLTNRNNVTIRNCRIVGGYTIGIQVTQNNTVPNKNYYINIENNYVAGPYLYGILAYGSAIELTGNRVYDIGGQLNTYAMGIRLGGYPSGFRFHILKDNVVAGTNSPYNNAYGIYSDNSSASILVHNAVSGFTATNTAFRGYGIRLAGTENRISDNHILGGGATGYGIFTSADGQNACYDNYVRAATRTVGCDATLGNY